MLIVGDRIMQIADIQFFVIMMFFTLYVVFRALEVLTNVIQNILVIYVERRSGNNGADKE